MTNLTFDVQAAAVQRRLQQLAGTDAVRRALAALGRVLVNRIRLGFRSGTSPYGSRWAPPLLRSGQPLIDTGRLRSSITSQVQGSEVVVGTNVAYAPVHQFGAAIVPRRARFLAVPTPTGLVFLRQVTIPARPFMPIRQNRVDLPGAWATSGLDAMAKALGL